MPADLFEDERKAIAELLQDLRELLAATKEVHAKALKPMLDASSYALDVIGTDTFAYRYLGSTDPAHHLCARCYAMGMKSPLQKVSPDPIMADKRYCPVCGESYMADKL